MGKQEGKKSKWGDSKAKRQRLPFQTEEETLKSCSHTSYISLQKNIFHNILNYCERTILRNETCLKTCVDHETSKV